jgi:hypothetical protein
MIKHWFVPSNSHPKRYYDVEYSKETGWKCECPGFFFRTNCTHIDSVRKILQSRIIYLGEW